MRTGDKRCCKVALFSTSVALMIGVTSLVVYFAWSVTVHSHVTEITVKDGSHHKNSSNGVQLAQTQDVDNKERIETKHEQTNVKTLDTNSVRVADRRRRKKGRKNPNDIFNSKNKKSNREAKEMTEDKATEFEKQSSVIGARKRKNIYGFKKRKRKKVLEETVEVESISLDSSNINREDSHRVKGRLNLGFSSIESRLVSKRKTQRNKARSPWGTWSTCSVECGLGQQERVRSCGHHCQEIESKPCLTRPCEGSKMNDKWAYFEMFDLTEREVTSESGDACEMWMKCSNKSIHHYLANIAKLPSCPCFYPISLAVDDKVYDSDKEEYFSWEDASGPSERNDVYKPGAKFCIRSRLPKQSITLAAQHCCYDDQLRLITRGRDAGTPNLVSPQLSRELHKKVDLLPWITCKGDWTRYNLVIQPNNYRQCSENPCLGELRHQVKQAKSY